MECVIKFLTTYSSGCLTAPLNLNVKTKMNKKTKKINNNENLQLLINIGPATANRLNSIGITTIKQLKNSTPEDVYEKLKEAEGNKLDKCVLYQLRGAVLNIPWWLCKDE